VTPSRASAAVSDEGARGRGNRSYAGYVLILVLGLRRGEALGLGWDEVDIDAGELRVARQLQRVGGHLLRRETKTESSDAPLPLPDLHHRAQGTA
jgi:integrase